jgi:uncharacterized cupredoxin-like copper-binding protein
MKLKLPLAIATATFAFVAVAFPATTVASTTVTVRETEFRFALSKTTVPRGTVTFRIKNAGHLNHDFKINGRKSRMLGPGQSTTLTVTFTHAGRYQYICTVPGHAQAGMKGTLRVS